MTSDCQVLIVGAGPTGLVLACGLLARGVRARIIDKGDGVRLQSRALGIHARTLEVFDMMGVADRFVEHGQMVRRFHMYTDGKTLVRLELARNGSRFGYMLDVPQDVTETILRQRVAELGGRVEPGTELSGLSQDPGGVTAAVTGRGGITRAITADYVVGADGAHSRVRSELGLDFQGHPYAQDWLLADVRLDWDRPDDEMHAFFRRDGRPLICMPMREQRWRVILPYAGERDRRAPALEEIQQLVAERAPEPVPVSDLEVTGQAGMTRLYEVLRHGRHVLLLSGPDQGGNPAPWAHLLRDEVVAVAAANGMNRPPGSVYLLRPDGYVAARGSAASPDSLLDYLRLLFGTSEARQPAPAPVPQGFAPGVKLWPYGLMARQPPETRCAPTPRSGWASTSPPS